MVEGAVLDRTREHRRGTGAQRDPSARGPYPDELFEWKRRATIWRERALMAKAMCDTLQANVGDLRRLVKALDDERDAREAALASGQDEPELEAADREVPVEVPAVRRAVGRRTPGTTATGTRRTVLRANRVPLHWHGRRPGARAHRLLRSRSTRRAKP